LCWIKTTNPAVVCEIGRWVVLGPYDSEKSLQESTGFLAERMNVEVNETVRKNATRCKTGHRLPEKIGNKLTFTVPWSSPIDRQVSCRLGTLSVNILG